MIFLSVTLPRSALIGPPLTRRYGERVNDVIAVIGQALIDLVAAPDGTVAAKPGGGPYNTARTIGRLGGRASFLGRLSDDAFGRLLRAGLAESGVTLGLPGLTCAPTTLAIASISVGSASQGSADEGSAEYRFYLAGTSAADVEYSELAAAAPDGVAAVYVGDLALLIEPSGASIERLLLAGAYATGAPLVLIDPNCRPSAVPDRGAYLARLARLFGRADIVKASAEDLAYLYPGLPPAEAARALLTAGPALVLVTDGPRAARAFLAGSPDGPAREVIAAIPPVTVVDTIGAGDAFGGAFLTWWTRESLTRADLANPELVAPALHAAAEVASLTCTRPGADPPRLSDVPWPER
jgi:fructokinase